MNWILIAVLGYVVLQIVIAVFATRFYSQTETGYILADRQLGYVLGTFTIFATWFGAETCIGSSGSIYTEGLSGGTTDPFGYSGALLLLALGFGVLYWRLRLMTLADLLRLRFSKTVEQVGVLLMVPSTLFWAAAQIKAFGHILSTTAQNADFAAQIPWESEFLWVTVAATAIILYTFTGGMLADALTDILQGLLLITGLVLLTLVVIYQLGGVTDAWNKIPAERLQLFPDDPNLPQWQLILKRFDNWLTPMLAGIVAHELVARVLAVRSAAVAWRASLLGFALYLIVGLFPLFLALLGEQLIPGLTEETADGFLPLVAKKYLHPVLYVLFVGALVSAMLSTVDSCLLVGGSLLSHNLFLPLLGERSDREKMWLTRFFVVSLGVVAYLFSFLSDSVLDLVYEASLFNGGCMCVVVIMGLLTRRFGGHYAALATCAVGGGTWFYFFCTKLEWEEGSAIPTIGDGVPGNFLITQAIALTTYCVISMFENPPEPVGLPIPEEPAPIPAEAANVPAEPTSITANRDEIRDENQPIDSATTK